MKRAAKERMRMTKHGGDWRPGEASRGPKDGFEATDRTIDEKLARIVRVFQVRFAKKIVLEIDQMPKKNAVS